GIKNVDDEVHDDEDQRHQHYVRNDHGAVELIDAVDQQLAHAGPREHGFGDGGIGDQAAEFHADHRDYRDQDVAQDMAAHDAAGAHALGTREFHVFLRLRLGHAGGGQAQHQRDVGQRQVDGGHDDVRPAGGGKNRQPHAQHADRVAAPRGGQPAQPYREQQDQHHALPEVGQ